MNYMNEDCKRNKNRYTGIYNNRRCQIETF